MQAEAPGWISEASFPRDKNIDPWRQWASAAVGKLRQEETAPSPSEWDKDRDEAQRPAARGRKEVYSAHRQLNEEGSREHLKPRCATVLGLGTELQRPWIQFPLWGWKRYGLTK